jgi:hypothetical protein
MRFGTRVSTLFMFVSYVAALASVAAIASIADIARVVSVVDVVTGFPRLFNPGKCAAVWQAAQLGPLDSFGRREACHREACMAQTAW